MKIGKLINDNLEKNWKLYFQVILGIFLLVMAVVFFNNQKNEMTQTNAVLVNSDRFWVFAVIAFTFIYVFLQGLMYWLSFASIGRKTGLFTCVILFLKRNFVSVFLPAGGLTSLLFFSESIEKEGLKKSEIQSGSTIYGIVGIVSVVLIAIPAGTLALYKSSLDLNILLSLAFIVFCLFLIWGGYKLIVSKGNLYEKIKLKFPSFIEFIETFKADNINKKRIFYTLVCSILIDLVNIVQLYIAMLALHVHSSFSLSCIVYVASVVLLIVSPFLRGMGAIEFTMVYLLQNYGYSDSQAFSVTLVYRFAEFWLPLILGIFSFIFKLNRFIFRIFPALFLFSLGVIDIVSVLTPPLMERLNMVHQIFSLKTIMMSNYFVLLAGVLLVMTSFFMLKGTRNAFLLAIGLCAVSMIGNLLKSFDYEEAVVSFVLLAFLLMTSNEYSVKTRIKVSNKNIKILFFCLFVVFAYGMAGIYFMDYRYWHLNLSFMQKLEYVVRNLLLLKVHPLWKITHFSLFFFYSLNIWGVCLFCAVIYLLIRPRYEKLKTDDYNLMLAKDMLYKIGTSANDFFKVYPDKMIYFPKGIDGFVSYKLYQNNAVVLEEPLVGEEANYPKAVESFESYCKKSGLNTFYYRVPEDKLNYYISIGKKKVLIGQEAILSLDTFSLSGKDKKSIRNAVNHATACGLKVKIHNPPVKDGVLQKVESVSDDWLSSNKRKEIIFSQGAFIWDQLKTETLFTVENEEGMVVAFLNKLPDFGKKAATYDLLRYRENIVNGTVDYLLVEFFNYLKAAGYETVNLGFVPFSGFNDIKSKNFLESSLSFTSSTLKSLSEYQKGLRKSKDKFAPQWHNKYLVYEKDYDLIQFPLILGRITKYKNIEV